jgi:S1-C subfamily serine protease
MQDKIPVLSQGVELGSSAQLKTEPDETTRRLYETVAPSVVKIRNHTGRGSGFFFGREVVTDAHVIASGGPVEVTLQSGQRLPAQVSKIDFAHDLADFASGDVARLANFSCGCKLIRA